MLCSCCKISFIYGPSGRASVPTPQKQLVLYLVRQELNSRQSLPCWDCAESRPPGCQEGLHIILAEGQHIELRDEFSCEIWELHQMQTKWAWRFALAASAASKGSRNLTVDKARVNRKEKERKKNIHICSKLHILLCSLALVHLRGGTTFRDLTASRLSHYSPSVFHQVQNVTYYLKRK